jgi:hypothetical protein
MNKEFEKLTADEAEFFNQFVGAHVAPHATQTPQQAIIRDWTTFQHQPTNDVLIKKHLTGEQSLGLQPRWYPVWANIDVDNPKTQEKPVFDKLQELGIKHDQMLCSTTPRYRRNGNFRIYFKLEMRGQPATAGLQSIVLKRHFPRVEYNPRPNISDRLVCGFDSEFIDPFSRQFIKLDLRGKLDALKNVRPIEINELPFAKAELPTITQIKPEYLKGAFLREGRALLENGLQQGDYKRYDAQHRVIFLLWKTGSYNPEQTSDFVKEWIRAKHNNLSDSVNRGEWKIIDGEIDRQVEKVFTLIANVLPDNAHNRTTAITAADVMMAAKFAPGDAWKQIKFFNLLKFIRPVFHWEWVTIRGDRWQNNIAGRKYTKFQRELERKGLMVSDLQYIKGSQSRKFNFNFELDDGEALKDAAGRNIDNYYEALEAVCGNRREIQKLTKIHSGTLSNIYNKQQNNS